MEKQEAQRRLEELREQVRYHSRKYYTEDDPEISDFAYDQLYRQLEETVNQLLALGQSLEDIRRHFNDKGESI